MKKTAVVLALLLFVAGCAVIDKQFTEPQVRVEPRESYGYTPMYSHYYSPYMWSGWYGWYSPYWLYGYYSPYGYYNPYFWGWYFYPTRDGGGEKIVIDKDQLSKSSVRAISRKTATRTPGRTIRSTGSRSSAPRSGSGRPVSSRSGSSSSGRSSGGRRVIKK